MTAIGRRLDRLSAAFARRHQELANAIAAGRDWLGIDDDSLPGRMAFIRAATRRPLWLPPVISLARSGSRQRSQTLPIPAAPGPGGQKASVTFGNLADIGKALRTVRKIRREDREQQADAIQPAMFDL